MNAVSLAVAAIRARPLQSALCVLSATLGSALLVLIFLLSQTIASGFLRNAEGIDIVAGAKSSPLQLVLSSVYHADVPAGNIEMSDYLALQKNRHVRQAIPLALGDNYQGWRMVGSTPDYLQLYQAEFAQGRVFEHPFEAVVGAATGMKMGESFAARHGFAADSDDIHDAYLYTVSGVLKPTGTVLDRLIVTSVESVQTLHSGHHHGDHDAHEEDDHDHEAHDHDDHDHDTKGHDAHDHDAHDDDAAEEALGHQVTAVLIKTRSPIDRMNLPREINQSSNLLAAVPSLEMARLTKSLGIGKTLILALGAGFIALSALILLASLASSLAARRYDLAVLRVLGASPGKLLLTVLAEGVLLSGVGTVIGLGIGHGVGYIAALNIDTLQGIVLPSTFLQVHVLDGVFLILGLMIGVIASLIPAISAARTDIAALLAKG
ncbi:MAG: ABC transporter permease [Alphaproteobacteria bacterium]|nr:ABC transporter permease [Alphaproteobacteria bacterium]